MHHLFHHRQKCYSGHPTTPNSLRLLLNTTVFNLFKDNFQHLINLNTFVQHLKTLYNNNKSRFSPHNKISNDNITMYICK